MSAAIANEQDTNTVATTIPDRIAIRARSFRRRVLSDRKAFFLVENIGNLLDRRRHVEEDWMKPNASIRNTRKGLQSQMILWPHKGKAAANPLRVLAFPLSA